MTAPHRVHTVSDADLVGRVRSGDKAAFDRLVEQHQRRATSVAYRLVGNLQDALEVVQESFIRAYQNVDRLEDPTRFAGWLLRIVTNQSLNFRRDRAVRPHSVSLSECIRGDGEAQDVDVASPKCAANGPGAELSGRELRDLIQLALQELPERQRTALVLFSLEQMPQKEVADIMSTSVEAVKWHVFQARKKLKDRLAAYL